MKERNYGIDLLRMLSMFLVVMLHVLGQGGVLAAAAQKPTHYATAWYMEIFAYCAVNVFALISGYVMCNSRPKLSRLAELWLQVAFYTVGLSLIFFYLYPETVTTRGILNAIFPVTSKHYWYISAYFGLYLLTPILNKGLELIEPKALRNLLAAVFIALSILPTMLATDPYSLGRGYSLIWLLILYCVGAYIKKADLINKINPFLSFGLFLALVTLTWGYKLFIEKIVHFIPNEKLPLFGSDMFISYTSPTIVLAGLFLLLAVARLKLPGPLQKVISVLSPAALGVYLIHVSVPVWQHVMTGITSHTVENSASKMALLLVGYAVAIYLICTAIELIRIWIFKLLRVKKLCQRIDSVIRL